MQQQPAVDEVVLVALKVFTEDVEPTCIDTLLAFKEASVQVDGDNGPVRPNAIA